MNVAIIGGGLSGTLMAYYLLKADAFPLTVLLFEKDYQQLARGIAYRSSSVNQLLNVPASKMNIYGFPEGDFYKWLCSKTTVTLQPSDFVPRAYFGHYLKEIFELQLTQARQVTLKIITDEVIDVVKSDDSIYVFTESNNKYCASYLVLANGILPPDDPFKLSLGIKLSGIYQSNPWDFQYLNKVNHEDHVVLIGTGLTMLDHAASILRSDKKLKVTAISRRGMLPLPHAPYEPYSFPEYNIEPERDIGKLFRTIRLYYHAHRPFGLSWRDLLDRIRLQVPQLWKTLSKESRLRFIRHLKPYWEVHRHRAPQQILDIIAKAKLENRFTLVKGRIHDVQLTDTSCLKVIVQTESGSKDIEANYLLNSTGLQSNLKLVADPLLRNLQKRGYMLPDPNGLGVEVDNDGALQCTNSKKNIFSLGALRRSSELECTAAREIGEQAFLLSNYLQRNCLTKTI